MAWTYQREESNEYPELPEGRYRLMIESAEMAVSKNNNDMLVVKFAVSGSNSHLWHYISFLEDRPQITNRMLTQLFDAFDIPEGDFNLNHYIGKAGGAQVKHDDQGRAKIHYFLRRNQLDELPPWQGSTPTLAPMPDEDDDDLPF